ncbi:MAG: glutamate--tRNA ligase [Candidatus Paceibacterota bacterium]
MSQIVTRFAPSPTGYFHAGSYRTALFSHIFARQNKGKFILRIEDTDKDRSKKEYEENITDSLKWLGLTYDEFYRQSDRTDVYREQIKRLIDSGHAYVSKEESREGDKEPRRGEVIRFKNPKKKVSFDDMIRGKVEFDTTELGDFVIAKSETEPVFHMAVVVDDATSGVTHVIRGEDHISNTPRHILLYEALGFPVPQYAHIPLLLSADRSKLSKRKGAVPITEYRNRGFLPEAVVNYLVLLGWHPADDRELLSFDEIVSGFSLERVQKGGAIFDESKLLWFNRQYILKLSDEALTERAIPFLPEWLSVKHPIFRRLLPVLKDKISTFGEVAGLFDPGGELYFVRQVGEYQAAMLPWKKDPDPAKAAVSLRECLNFLKKLDDSSFTAPKIKEALWPYVEARGKGDVLWPLRVALTGQERSPDPFLSAEIIGREESINRINAALNKLA